MLVDEKEKRKENEKEGKKVLARVDQLNRASPVISTFINEEIEEILKVTQAVSSKAMGAPRSLSIYSFQSRMPSTDSCVCPVGTWSDTRCLSHQPQHDAGR